MCHLSLLGCPSHNSLPQSSHNPRTSKPDLVPEAMPSSLLGVSPWLFFLPQIQHTKSQGRNTEHPRTAHKVGFAFTHAPIRLVRGCYNPPTILPQSTHKQTRPCARGHALLPARCFALAFFPPTNPTHKKPRQKHRTPSHRPQGRVCFSSHCHAECSKVLGVCMLIVVQLASFHHVEAFLSSHKATLHGFRSRGIVVRVAGGGGGSGGSVVLVARRGSSALY